MEPPSSPLDIHKKHPNHNRDIIIKLFEAIQNFTVDCINHYLQYLIPDELSYLVPDFQQRMVPIMKQKAQDIISVLLSQQATGELEKQLVDVEMAEESLEFKDRSC
jgi:hypothetical protein